MKKAVYIIVLLLSWLLLMMVAHDMVAKRLTSDNQQQLNDIQSGNYDFVISAISKDNVVESFQKHWQQRNGLISITEQPEISINLDDFKVQPTIHQAFKIDVEIEQGLKGVFKIEFSNQAKQHYFDSNEISLDQLNQEIDLTAVSWTINRPLDDNDMRAFVGWEEIGLIDAWVIRFYPNKLSSIKLNSVSIMQSKLMSDNANKISSELVPCEELFTANIKCHVTNGMRYLDQNSGSQLDTGGLEFTTLISVSQWYVLLLAWLLFVGVIYHYFDSAAVMYGLVTMVFLSLVMLYRDWFVSYFVYLNWILVLGVLVALWSYRSVFLELRNKAWPLWVVSVVLAVLMLGFSSIHAGFVYDLPLYFLWACVQQLFIGPIGSQLIKQHSKLGDFNIAFMVGVLFSIIHAPNHMLMLATLVAGTMWSYAWLKYQNIYANAFSHALLALVFFQVMPDAWLGTARVGMFF